MEKLGVSPDLETLSTYILPVFPSLEAARQALKDLGISVDSEAFVCAEVRSLAASDLAKVYTISKLTHKHINSHRVSQNLKNLCTIQGHPSS
ncbi:hypothetical protein XENOCAPTIV_007326 [Xenoophorus captivus]|uniref:Uncharacterized protein n=1 Tax=Xenoophorus captivus TaxID=1517983 RepID=A0ABV0R7G6_9TELE